MASAPSKITVLNTPGKTIAARVKSVDSYGAESAYAVGQSYTIIYNASPTISGEDMDLGQFSKDPFNYNYTVDDRDAGDIVTVTEKIIDANGMETILRTYEAVKGEETAVVWTPKAWLSIPVGTHKLIITAEDGAGGYAIRTLTFTRSVDEVSFYRTVATDAMVYKVFISIFPTKDDLPLDCVVSAEITNNPFDSAPVWEDISDALNSRVHTFANNTAKNGYGIGYRIRLDKEVAKVWAETVVIRFA